MKSVPRGSDTRAAVRSLAAAIRSHTAALQANTAACAAVCESQAKQYEILQRMEHRQIEAEAPSIAPQATRHWIHGPWGSWSLSGVWRPNPHLKMSASEQYTENVKGGYIKPSTVPRNSNDEPCYDESGVSAGAGAGALRDTPRVREPLK